MIFGKGNSRVVISMVAAVAITLVWYTVAVAQCPLCRLAVENSVQGKAMGRGLNLGILVLIVPPVTVFCSIFVLAIKKRKAPERSREV